MRTLDINIWQSEFEQLIDVRLKYQLWSHIMSGIIKQVYVNCKEVRRMANEWYTEIKQDYKAKYEL